MDLLVAYFGELDVQDVVPMLEKLFAAFKPTTRYVIALLGQCVRNFPSTNWPRFINALVKLTFAHVLPGLPS